MEMVTAPSRSPWRFESENQLAIIMVGHCNKSLSCANPLLVHSPVKCADFSKSFGRKYIIYGGKLRFKLPYCCNLRGQKICSIKICVWSEQGPKLCTENHAGNICAGGCPKHVRIAMVQVLIK